MTHNETYQTTDLHLAAFLLTKNYNLINIEKARFKNECVFVFEQSEELQKIIYHYNFARKNDNQVKLDVREYTENMINLKKQLFSILSTNKY